MGPKIGSKIALNKLTSTSLRLHRIPRWKAMVFESGGWLSDRSAGGGVVRRGKLRRRIVNYRLRGNAFLTPDLGSLHVKYFQHHPGNFILSAYYLQLMIPQQTSDNVTN